ncbi:MAG: DUF616 domain-containing protein [Lachnospiraceae bacterium]|nr:DUF616 domain-containing protein [Lachnospiraceae bacterium]
MEKWIIYGTGKSADYCIKYLYENKNLLPNEIVAVSDGNKEKWGMEYAKHVVISPNKIINYEFDYLLIASVYFEEIKNQLLDEEKIPISKIVGKEELGKRVRKKFSKWQYEQHQMNHKWVHECDPISTEKMVVYTANFGGYDQLYDPDVVEDDVDYVCFTDDRDFKSDIWNIQYIDTSRCASLPLMVREYKMKPHKYFKEYSTSIWIDSSLQIKKELREYIQKYSIQSPMLCFPHSERHSVYDEAKRCIELKKGNKNDLERQIKAYREAGYIENLEMAECACLVRAHNNKELIVVMEDWWNEVCMYSKRDQISFPYACWKNQFHYDLSDLVVFECEYFEYRNHLEK